MDYPYPFDHERLDAYRVAREFLVVTARILAAMPRGEAAVADQLRRAADSALLNLGEGVARTSPRDKARCYDIARGSAAESAVALDVLAIRGLATRGDLQVARSLAYRLVCLIGGLARSARARASAG